MYATLWKLSLEGNNRIFRNKSKLVEEVVDSIVWSVSGWVSKRKEFDGVPLEDLKATFVMRGWRAKIMPKASWVPSLVVILQLNFDESFVKYLS